MRKNHKKRATKREDLKQRRNGDRYIPTPANKSYATSENLIGKDVLIFVHVKEKVFAAKIYKSKFLHPKFQRPKSLQLKVTFVRQLTIKSMFK